MGSTILLLYMAWVFIGFIVSVTCTNELRRWKILINFHIWPWVLFTSREPTDV